MKVLKWAVVLLMAALGLTAGAPALASPAPYTQADVTYLQLLDQNGVSDRNPEAMVSGESQEPSNASLPSTQK
jgi:hypothetical protein